MVSTQEPSAPAGCRCRLPRARTDPTTVANVSRNDAEERPSGGLGVGMMVLLVFTVTILAGLGDTAINGSITYITGAVFVVISVISAATINYRDLSTAIITPRWPISRRS